MTTAGQARAASLAPPRLGNTVALPVRWALYLLAFSIPLEAPDRFPLEVTVMTGTLFVLTSALEPRRSYGIAPVALACYILFLVAELVAFVIQGEAYPGGLWVNEVAKTVLRLGTWILLFWACANLLQHESLYRAVLWALVLGCLVRVVLPLLGLARTVSVKGAERVAALGQNPNQSALVLGLGLLALVGLTYLRPRGTRARTSLVVVGIALVAVGIVQTGSRGGLASTAIGVLILSFTGSTLRVRIRNLALVLLVLGGMGLVVARSDTMLARLEKAGAGQASGREVIFPILVDMFREKPLLGWGPVTNKYELASRLGDPEFGRRDTHNVVLEILTATGLLGAIPFLLGTGLCLQAAWRARAGPRGAVPLAMVVAMLAGSMTQNRLTWPFLWLVLAVGLASGAPPPAPKGVATPSPT